jgi:hypothetical protein
VIREKIKHSRVSSTYGVRVVGSVVLEKPRLGSVVLEKPRFASLCAMIYPNSTGAELLMLSWKLVGLKRNC